MALEPGTRLGHYEVLSSLGAGGMGEVYRARDTKLGREVAIKVLPEGFSDEAERMARSFSPIYSCRSAYRYPSSNRYSPRTGRSSADRRVRHRNWSIRCTMPRGDTGRR